MKTSLATEKVREIKTYYQIRVYFIAVLCLLVFAAFLFFYLTSAYGNFSWSTWMKEHLSFLFSSSSHVQGMLAASFVLLSLALEAGIIILTLFLYNGKYQKEYQETVFRELKLNEIYFHEKKAGSGESRLEKTIDESGRTSLQGDYRFSLQSLMKIDVYQVFEEKFSSRYRGLLLISDNETDLPFYFQISKSDRAPKEEYEGKSVLQYPFRPYKNSSYYLYVNSSFGKLTQSLLSEEILKAVAEFSAFTKTDFTFTLHHHEVSILIDGWELHLSDSLWQRLSYDRVDRKVEAITELIDFVTDITIYLSRNYREVMKNGK